MMFTSMQDTQAEMQIAMRASASMMDKIGWTLLSAEELILPAKVCMYAAAFMMGSFGVTTLWHLMTVMF